MRLRVSKRSPGVDFVGRFVKASNADTRTGTPFAWRQTRCCLGDIQPLSTFAVRVFVVLSFISSHLISKLFTRTSRINMEPTDATSLARHLRLFTFLTTAIAVPLNIAATVLSLKHPQGGWWRQPRRTVTAYCFVFIPLALTCFAASTSLVYIKKHGKNPRSFHLRALDFSAICFYIAVMIPCWAVEIRKFNSGGFGLLTGYLTAPMIVNM